MEVKKIKGNKMKKEEIINKETLINFCYEKALKNVLKNWSFLSNKEKMKINSNDNRSTVLDVFFKMHERIRIDEEIELIEKYYIGNRIKYETNKCINKYRKCTPEFTARIEYFITREII
jgi:hypothetical protein